MSQKIAEHTRHVEPPNSLEDTEYGVICHQHTNNLVRQVQAMSDLDISTPLGGSMEEVAAGVRAAVLVVYAIQDHSLNLIQPLVLPGWCPLPP